VRRTLTDAGQPGTTLAYDPWGQVRVGAVPTFGFTGELQDAAGLVYLRARWYHAAQGRFGAKDPWAGEAERPYSLHAYQYAYGDPVRLTDPSGQNPACLTALLAGPAGPPLTLGCVLFFAAAGVLVGGSVSLSLYCQKYDCSQFDLGSLLPPTTSAPHGEGQPPAAVSAPHGPPQPAPTPVPLAPPEQPTGPVTSPPWATPCADDVPRVSGPWPQVTPGPVVLAAQWGDLNQLPQGLKPSDMRGKTWAEVQAVLEALGAEKRPPANPNYKDDQKYRWWDQATGALWEVRYHMHKGTVRFGRLLANSNGDTILDQDEVDAINAGVRESFKRASGGRPAPPTYGGRTTTWIDQMGWLYYGPHDKPVGVFTEIGYTIKLRPPPQQRPRGRPGP
jgi:RHS repeat-associated protein